MKPALLSLIMVFLTGCGRVSVSVTSGPDASYDSAVAKQTLIAALDAWKQGKAGMLAKQKPPIRFSDDDVRAGFRLVDYRLTKPDEPIQKAQSVSVMIQVARGKATPVEREAWYQVSLAPQPAVLRADP